MRDLRIKMVLLRSMVAGRCRCEFKCTVSKGIGVIGTLNIDCEIFTDNMSTLVQFLFPCDSLITYMHNFLSYWSIEITSIYSEGHWPIILSFKISFDHYVDVIITAMMSQITSLTIVCSTDAGSDRRKQSSASLAFLQGIHRGPVNSPHKGPLTQKMFPFDDVIMMSV